MSRKLLSQLVDADMANWSITTLNHSHKRASGTTPKKHPTIEQGYTDDLEPSWDGAGKKGLMMEGWINPDTTMCIGAKYVLFCLGKATFLSQIHPYFKDLMALVDTWLEIMRHNDKEPALKLPLGQDVEMKRKRIVVPESEGTYISKKHMKAT
ncbi:hypothetical protein BDR03DRAFT_1014178 [Suillus americanus]|nr:hypothetical protein BDR03DRAFT_1014178 [Suillus americanus]